MKIFYLKAAPWRTTCGSYPRYAILRDDLSRDEINYVEVACGEQPKNPVFHFLCDADVAFEILRARMGSAKDAREVLRDARVNWVFENLREFEIFLRERDAPRYAPLYCAE